MKVVNKKAYFDYFVIEDFVAGLVLTGSEVKSLRRGDVNFNDGYIIFKDGELFIKNMRIAQYKEATYNNHEEMRDKKILLTKKEIGKISKSYDEKGITVIPLEIFTLKNRFKIKLGVCRGKKNWNKKESIKAKDIEREIRRDNGYNI
jgi:SsrA-binding protein